MGTHLGCCEFEGPVRPAGAEGRRRGAGSHWGSCLEEAAVEAAVLGCSGPHRAVLGPLS